MIDKNAFFDLHNLTDDDLIEASITWEELCAIAEDYEQINAILVDISKLFLNEYLYDIDNIGIHSYRHRIKSTDHLLEKIVRKKISNPKRYGCINVSNYKKIITDLIGVRVFFLYREDWIAFHNYITNVFENNPKNYLNDRLADYDEDVNHNYIAEKPKVFKRSGDPKVYDSTKIDIIADGIYRSLHYILKYKGFYIEIQGRTLFEEGWGEIDHNIVYPAYSDNEMLNDFSKLLNRIAGMADEMSSYFRRIKEHEELLEKYEKTYGKLD